MTTDDYEHFGPDCPQCQAIAAQVKAMGSIAEWLESRIADGTFERLGAEMAMRREKAFMEAFLGRPL
jgi:hypothetical protein